MDDVLLPLPGSDVVFPAHEVNQAWYEKMLAADGLTMEMYSTCNVTYRMRGTYRKVVQKAKGFAWSVLSYNNNDEELIVTELSQFRTTAEGTAETPETTTISRPPSAAAVEGSTDGGERFRALKLQFFLPPGTYATMLLRELTKESTESMHQAKLSSNNNAFAFSVAEDAAPPAPAAEAIVTDEV